MPPVARTLRATFPGFRAVGRGEDFMVSKQIQLRAVFGAFAYDGVGIFGGEGGL